MKAEFNWFPGHMNKTLKEIEKRIPIVDLVIEIVDARAPYSSQNMNFRKLLKSKKVLYVMSKADIADPNVTLQWKQYIESNGNFLIVLDDKNKIITKELIRTINLATKEKQERDKRKGLINSLINVLVIGIPNVGKSTFINRIVKDKNVKAGNTPGLTRGIQFITLDKTITLMDTPGVLPSKLENKRLAVNVCGINSIKENVYPIVEISSCLMENIYPKYSKLISDFFGIENIEYKEAYEIFSSICQKRKWFLSNGELDLQRAMVLFMRQLANGKIGKISYETPKEIETIYE